MEARGCARIAPHPYRHNVHRMPAYKLCLHPSDADTGLADPQPVVTALEALGIIGEAFPLDGHTHYRTGPAFLEHLSFLGCSPVIELAPPATAMESAARRGAFCHLQVLNLTEPRLRRRPEPLPRCRRCRGSITELTPPSSTCPACGATGSLADLNWRQAGAYARVFLDIWSIHPAEAVPGERLLAALAGVTGTDWGFCYLED